VAEHAPVTVEGTGATSAVPYNLGHLEHNSGRPISWVGTSVVIVGFLIGGIAMVPSPHWLFFWIGAAVAIIGCLILLFSRAMHTDWY
jgi:hypothetical protein